MKLNKIAIITASLIPLIFMVVTFLNYTNPTVAATSEVQGEKGHDDHDKDQHDEQAEEGHEDGEEQVVKLNNSEIKEFEIEIAEAGAGVLRTFVNLPGEVTLNADRLIHVVPRVPGIVRSVQKKLGDHVKKGEVMAELDSRDLADAKAAYMAARERISIATANFNREEGLWKKKISSEMEFLEVKQVLTEARIELRSTEQQLHALGFSEEYLKTLPDEPDASYTSYKIEASFDGTVIEKHIVLGEVLKDDSEAFIIADLSSVWVDINVYQKDLPLLKKGQKVIVKAGHGIPDIESDLLYIGPLVGEETRTALARVVIENEGNNWRPGMFITASIASKSATVPILIPKSALLTLEEKPHVFIKDVEGFKPVAVITGLSNDTQVEIVNGLNSGQQYVAKGAFTLKAQLSKGAFGDGHGH